jgi:hypothetical protein
VGSQPSVTVLDNREGNYEDSNNTCVCIDTGISQLDKFELNNSGVNLIDFNVANMDYFDIYEHIKVGNSICSNFNNDSVNACNDKNIVYTESLINVVNNDIITEGEYVSIKTEFGFQPYSKPDIYYGPTGKAIDSVHDLLELAEILRCSDYKNYIAKIKPLNTHINVPRMRVLAEGYYDMQALDLLEFGFPLDMRMTDFTPNTQAKNHPSANNYINDVHKYIREEMEHGVMLGPYDFNDFVKVHVSPLMSRPKDTDKRRIIVDL